MEKRTVKQEMELYLDNCIKQGNNVFEFYYDEDFDNVYLMNINVNSEENEQFIHIPSFVSYVHYSVIADNKNLNSCKIFIPKECEIEWNYGKWETGRKQKFFHSAKEIIIEEGHPQFLYEDGVVFNGNKKELLIYPSNKKDEDYAIPENVTTVGIDAFLNNEHLRRLYIPKKVRKIEPCIFDSRVRINVDPDNKIYKSINGSLYNMNGKTAYHLCTDDDGNIKIAEGTEIIKEMYFCEEVNALYLPKSIKVRNGVSLIVNNYNMIRRALVPEVLKKDLKYFEKYIGIIYY